MRSTRACDVCLLLLLRAQLVCGAWGGTISSPADCNDVVLAWVHERDALTEILTPNNVCVCWQRQVRTFVSTLSVERVTSHHHVKLKTCNSCQRDRGHNDRQRHNHC
jgi:hypothetical protein